MCSPLWAGSGWAPLHGGGKGGRAEEGVAGMVPEPRHCVRVHRKMPRATPCPRPIKKLFLSPSAILAIKSLKRPTVTGK